MQFFYLLALAVTATAFPAPDIPNHLFSGKPALKCNNHTQPVCCTPRSVPLCTVIYAGASCGVNSTYCCETKAPKVTRSPPSSSIVICALKTRAQL
ncbi:hypothetical protein N656DRAFT_779450, partial [Canariomyces notabilis]